MKIRSIAEAKKKIKIGSKVMITTQKACAKDSFGAVKTGIPRQAVVIGIYEYFVHVQLESGVCESVMWMDLINAREWVQEGRNMFVKQIDMAKALELAAKGMEIKVLAPIGQEGGWENLVPDTLQNMLGGVMFFRQEPALEKEILPAVSGDAPEPPVEKTLSDLTKELKQARPAAKGKLDVDIRAIGEEVYEKYGVRFEVR